MVTLIGVVLAEANMKWMLKVFHPLVYFSSDLDEVQCFRNKVRSCADEVGRREEGVAEGLESLLA